MFSDSKINTGPNKVILALSLPAALLIIISSSISLLTENFYYKESFNWQVQSLGQDYINLFIVAPVLVFTALFAYRDLKMPVLLWAGCNLYLVYTYLIYCFSIHFNSLFIIYCVILGLSFYSIMYFSYLSFKIKPEPYEKITKVTGIYFIIISVLFYLLWLSEIIPSVINNSPPKILVETGLVTNPVHVIDISVLLPGVFFTGFMLVKKKPAGYLLAPVILVFFILMDITIGYLTILMKMKNIEGDLSIAILMGLLSLFSLLLLLLFHFKPKNKRL